MTPDRTRLPYRAARPLEGGRGPVPVGGTADQVVERVGRPDDPAGHRGAGLRSRAGSPLPSHDIRDLVENAGLADHVGAKLAIPAGRPGRPARSRPPGIGSRSESWPMSCMSAAYSSSSRSARSSRAPARPPRPSLSPAASARPPRTRRLPSSATGPAPSPGRWYGFPRTGGTRLARPASGPMKTHTARAHHLRGETRAAAPTHRPRCRAQLHRSSSQSATLNLARSSSP